MAKKPDAPDAPAAPDAPDTKAKTKGGADIRPDIAAAFVAALDAAGSELTDERIGPLRADLRALCRRIHRVRPAVDNKTHAATLAAVAGGLSDAITQRPGDAREGM